ncbi:Methyltransferase type 11 [Metarhizium album ARSEF 1941]|uniref:Methyltransferase type 11 n=1 Tax=Metarhizium album (strain ARSEF 1941) TaxID=1081103 RepID=A0A0B2WNT5_METAS|nr:Methyltransferase type 11 [Metarhizium album ARSEF 1941]KHN95294.1 Methyltransferase type 11 [Metarhizium album ARSEF 1941]
MADSVHLPSSFQSRESSLGRRSKRRLNPIIEEDYDDGHVQNATMEQQRRRGDASLLKIEAWLSPMSDHFPTPRGIHYLSAPVLPSSPSTASRDGSSPTTSSNMWNRASIGTENTDFEDLYDVSEDEDGNGTSRCYQQTSADRAMNQQQPLSRQPARLRIATNQDEPDESWPAVNEFKKNTSPVPLTPLAQLPMSPAQMNFIGKQQALEIPTISAPPSLDGSLSSEQLAALSAPPTPVTGHDEHKAEEAWAGVHLQPDALATLQALSGDDEGEGQELHERPVQVLDVSMHPVAEMQQQPLRLLTGVATRAAHNIVHSPNLARQSLAGLTRLSIPSPGGFFSGLSPRSRNTWHLPSKSPVDMPPPTSTTAEQFYRCPWNVNSSVPPLPKRPDSAEAFYRGVSLSSEPVEQVIQVQDDDDMTEGMPTARLVIPRQESNESRETTAKVVEETPVEIIVDYDPDYARKQQKEALSNLDRTELWLMAQRAYLKGVEGGLDNNAALKTIEELPGEDGEENDEKSKPESEPEQGGEVKRKVVRFSNVIPTSWEPKRLPSKLLRQESAYYRAFQDYIVRTRLQDVFVQQLCRFEAVQAQRAALRDTHRNQLLGKYQLSVVPQSAKHRLSANVARGDDMLTDDPERLRREKELEAMNQMTIPTWHVAALKFLNGGRLISAPVTKRLARLSHLTAPGKNGAGHDRSRILDLGGQSTCDWAWHCALQYPNAKVYTVTTKAIRQLSNSNIRGPPNHRQVAVKRLCKLPFADGQFDLISARELHGILKFVGENGEDEWESCLHECMRVLKPGGYLEFSVMDSDIMNAGPLGRAKSVEFGFSLKTLGYDPSPTKLWLGRLARAGFDDVRRAWVCLPVGARKKTSIAPTPPFEGDVSISSGKVCQMDAMVTGSSDNIANVCSVVGGWSWERWLLRCEMEKVGGEMRLADTVTTGAAMKEAGKCLDGVHAVMEEGRSCRAGFRMLNGWARKPKRCRDVIQIAFAH